MSIKWDQFFDAIRRTNILKLLTGFTILGAFIFQVIALMYLEIPESNRDAVNRLSGLIDAAFIGGLVQYFFGSSKKEHDLTNDNRDPSKPPDKP